VHSGLIRKLRIPNAKTSMNSPNVYTGQNKQIEQGISNIPVREAHLRLKADFRQSRKQL
jgi:hypothetical protein